MNKKETTAVHAVLAHNQGAHADGQVGPHRQPRYDRLERKV